MLCVLWLVAAAFAVDVDGDGFHVDAQVDPDCDDRNALVNPGMHEQCENPSVAQIDNDCDGNYNTDRGQYATSVATLFVGMTADRPFYPDEDGDYFGDASATAFVYLCGWPGQDELLVADASDCDDTNEAVNPVAPELCNNQDDDCDEEVDEPSSFGHEPLGPGSALFYVDHDADGYGVSDSSVLSFCEGYLQQLASSHPVVGGARIMFFGGRQYSELDGDCDDSTAQSYPRQGIYPERVDGHDNDCDGLVLIDELDCDEDGESPVPVVGDCRSGSILSGPQVICGDDSTAARCNEDTGDWEVATDELRALYAYGARIDRSVWDLQPTDCDDNDDRRYRAAREVCDGFDTSCAGTLGRSFDEPMDGVSDAVQGGIPGVTTEVLLDTDEDGEVDACAQSDTERVVNGSGPVYPAPDDEPDTEVDTDTQDRTPSTPSGCSCNNTPVRFGWPLWSLVALALVAVRRWSAPKR